MLNLPNAQITQLLKSYKFNELYALVKDAQYEESIPIQKQTHLALKAMLLSSWWGDNVNSKILLNHFPPLLSDPFIHFCIAHAWLALGEQKKINHYYKNPPKKQPKWMKTWLEIEYFGRSLQDEKQIALLKKTLKENQEIEDYLLVALSQSLEHNHTNLSFLKEFLNKEIYLSSTNPLMQALLIRVELIKPDALKDITHSVVMNKYGIHLLRNLLLKDALILYDKLAQAGFMDMNSLDTWMQLSLTLPQGRDYFFNRYDYALATVPNTLFAKGTVGCYGMIYSWIKGDYVKAYSIAQEFHTYRDEKNKKIRTYQIFYSYIISLCVSWQHNKIHYSNDDKPYTKLTVLGESHSLSSSNFYFEWMGGLKKGLPMFVMGIKMHHLANPKNNHQSSFLLECINSLEQNSDAMFTIGEIDTRPDEGIWKVVHEKSLNIETIIDETVGGYIEFLKTNLKDKNLNSVTIQGIPAPAYPLEGDKDPKDKEGFLNMIKKVNEKLKELTLAQNYNFLDVYSATVDESGISNKKWHLDGYHLQPIFYTQANKWLIISEQNKPTQEIKQEPSTAIDFSKIQTLNLSKP